MQKVILHHKHTVSGILLVILFTTSLMISVPFVNYATWSSKTSNDVNNDLSAYNSDSRGDYRWDSINHETSYRSLLSPLEDGTYGEPVSSFSSVLSDISPFGIPHAPIFIDDDSDFETQGWPGEGNVEHPYIIAGLQINATTGVPAINITGTTAHFFIKDCWLTSNQSSVVMLISVSHARIKNNTIVNSDQGVVAVHSTDLTIYENFFSSFSSAGIALHNSSNCIITSNRLEACYISIEIEGGSSFNEITYNNCTLFAGGVVVWYNADSNVVSGNNCSGMYSGEVGIYIAASEYCDVTYNHCNQSYYNIVVEASNHTDITDNICFESAEQCLAVWGCHFINVEGNTLVLGYTGLYVETSTFITVKDNSCFNFSSAPVTGMHFVTVSDSIIEGNELRYNNEAMAFESCVNCSIRDNTCVQNGNGIILAPGNDGMVVEENQCHLIDEDAIVVYQSSSCIVTRNTCTNITGVCLIIYQASANASWNEFRLSGFGIDVVESECLVTHNTIEQNTVRGLYLLDNIEVNVTWNIFESNNLNAYTSSIGVLVDYNYWSNYTGIDANADGIGDTWHPIDGDGYNDTHPLMFYPTIPSWTIEPTDQYSEYGEEFLYTLSIAIPPKAAAISEWWISDSHFVIDSGVVRNESSLSLGEYQLEVRAYNLYGFYLSGTFAVTVDDTIAPLISGSEDFSYPSDSTGYFVHWYAIDAGPVSYNVILDGIIVQSGAWNVSNEEVFILCDGLEVGEHNYTITFVDIGGNSASDTVIVTVTLSPSQIFGPILGLVIGGTAIVVVIAALLFVRKKTASK